MLVDKRKLVWLTYQQEKVKLKELIGQKQAILLQEIMKSTVSNTKPENAG